MRDRAQRLLIDAFWITSTVSVRARVVNRDLSGLLRDDRLAPSCASHNGASASSMSCNCLFGHHSFSDQLLCVEGTRAGCSRMRWYITG